jgi:hypothetical protein
MSEALADNSRLDRALTLVAATLERQREAAIAGDAAGLTRSVENLAQLLVELDTLLEELPAGQRAGIPQRLKQIRSQVRVNSTLSLNGLSMTDHWFSRAAESAESNGLFRGVA